MIMVMSRVDSGEDLHPLRAVGTPEQSANPLPQVRDLVQVLVRGGVTGQFAQVVGDAAGADVAGGVQGRVSDAGGLKRSPVAIVRMANLVRQTARPRVLPAVCPAAAAVSRLVASLGLQSSITRSARGCPVNWAWLTSL